MEQQAKRVPYGVSAFKSFIAQTQSYVVKTLFLTDLEKEPNNRFFIRPRRFGKSTLHRIIMQFKGWELARMEEV